MCSSFQARSNMLNHTDLSMVLKLQRLPLSLLNNKGFLVLLFTPMQEHNPTLMNINTGFLVA